MKLTRAERTTTINFDDEDNTCHVVTYSKKMITNLRNNPAATEVQQYPGGGVYFQIPKSLFRNFGKPRAPRQVSEATKQKLRENIARAREARTEG
jgi:hypothetical protein